MQREKSRPGVVTVLVNWNGSDDTIECLESLFNSDYPDQRVVVVDNGSKDGSLAKLTAWAAGKLSMRHKTAALDDWIPKPCSKPVRCVTLSVDDESIERGWDRTAELFLIDAKRNHGFAGGVNIGIRFALLNLSVQYVWVLNNDTVVAPDCLSRMEQRVHRDDAVGMCGSRILFYWQPGTVQVLGGARYLAWTGTSRLLGSGESASAVVSAREVERKLDHLSGASMLVSRSFLNEVGLMDESYFLYYEETDWAMRGKQRYRLVYADDAVVYHKEGASIGSSHRGEKRSPLSSFFMVRSRLRFTRRFFPWALPSVMAYSALAGLRALARRRHDQARAIFAALRGLSAYEALGWTPD
ncbi:MAG: glycosyltransferase family 2 protein [Burkholderiales bacterium]